MDEKSYTPLPIGIKKNCNGRSRGDRIKVERVRVKRNKRVSQNEALSFCLKKFFNKFQICDPLNAIFCPFFIE